MSIPTGNHIYAPNMPPMAHYAHYNTPYYSTPFMPPPQQPGIKEIDKTNFLIFHKVIILS